MQEEGQEDVSAFLPLTTVVFEVLLALSDKERHGYAILQEVESRTAGAVRLRPGSLYRAVNRMLDLGFIEECEERPAPAVDDERRRYYRMTLLGRQVARAEAERLEGAVASARSKKLLGGQEIA